MRAALIAAAVLVCAAGLGLWVATPKIPEGTAGNIALSFGDTVVRVELATTSAARARGLSGRSVLAEGEGLLFVFPQEDRHAFWMKDMYFPIDILWLSSEGRVLSLAAQVRPDSYPASFRPPVPARYVLELPGGYAQAHDVGEGSSVGGIPAGLASE